MARVGTQNYADITAIIGTVDSNDNNDLVLAKAERRLYMWVAGSTETHDGKMILEQANDVTGRFHAVLGAKSVLTGSGTAAAIPNGNQIVTTVTVTGVIVADFTNVKVTNNDALTTAGIEVVNAYVSADDTVKVVLLNTIATDIPYGQTVDVSVLSI